MSVPLDYSQRIALQKARASATATYEKLAQQLDAPVAQQAPTPEAIAKAAREANDQLTYLVKAYMDTHDGALPREALDHIFANPSRQQTLWKPIVTAARIRKSAPARTMSREEQAFYDANPHLRRRG
jgi:hypothetical protein